MISFWTLGRTVGEATREVFTWSYLLLAAVISAVAFLSVVWLPNIGLLANVITSSDVTIALKWQLATGLLGSILTNFTLTTAIATMASVVLFGMNTAMISYFLRRQRRLVSQGTLLTGISGLVAGALGIGCAACGSFLLTSLFVSFGASGLILWLPLRGAELGVIGFILLFLTLVLVSRAITQATACRITSPE